jgi:FlgN protein
MSRQLADLENILQEMLVEHRRLLGHMEQHQEAMHAINHKLMDEISQRQEASRLRLVGLESRRRIATQQLAKVLKVEGDLSLRRIAELCPQRSQAILQVRQDLREAIQAVRLRAQIAGRVARAVLGHLNTVVRLLAGAVEKAGLYTKNGVPRLATRIGVMETVG